MFPVCVLVLTDKAVPWYKSPTRVIIFHWSRHSRIKKKHWIWYSSTDKYQRDFYITFFVFGTKFRATNEFDQESRIYRLFLSKFWRNSCINVYWKCLLETSIFALTYDEDSVWPQAVHDDYFRGLSDSAVCGFLSALTGTRV